MPDIIATSPRNGGKTAPRDGMGRQSRPTHWTPYSAGGIGIIPRRILPSGIKAHTDLCDTNSINRFARTESAFRLFDILLDLHPALKQAKSNNLRLVFGEGKTRLVAYTEDKTGDGKDIRDDAKTSELEDLFKSQPNETGGLIGLQSALAIKGMVSGMGCLEAVPGPRGTGVRRLWVVDPLTISLGRPNNDPDADLAAYQRQMVGEGTQGVLGWYQLPDTTFKWSPIDPTPENPYGVGLFSAAFNQALADFASNQDLRDAVHNAAWPRLDFEYDKDRMLAFGKDVLELDNTQTDENGKTQLDRWYAAQVADTKAEIIGMDPDGNPVHSSDTKITPIPGGDFKGLDVPLTMERHRLVQSVDELPTLMGINDGSTQTYTSVEWGIRAEKAQWLRDWVNGQLIWACEKHFRLQGKIVTVRAECESVRASDALADERTRSMKIDNEAKLTRRGVQTLSDESQNTTGTGLPDEEAAVARQKVADADTGQSDAMGAGSGDNTGGTGTGVSNPDNGTDPGGGDNSGEDKGDVAA